jgi:cell division protein FtsZ
MDGPDSQDTPDDMDVTARAEEEEALAAALNEDAFVAPEPKMPQNLSEPEGRPDAFAEAAYENGMKETRKTDEEAPVRDASAPAERGMSLFRRMTSFGNRDTETDGRQVPSAQKPAPDMDKTAGAEGDGAARLGRMTPENRPVPSGRSDEQLEIPAFLRRQVN